MAFLDIIRKKRDGEALTRAEIDALVAAVTDGSAPDYQVSALLMAIFLNGMTETERGDLTQAMVHSGDVLDLSHLPGRKVDKHSTGGVGDKVSLCLAPAVAACGVIVPMVSGRGLGHTGGTLDKLEAIRGLQTRLETAQFLDVVQRCGFVMAGQSGDIAPADRKLYSLRDVTATVESLPLIASSIMSKKLAEGLDGLVLDVKVGDGAFMKTQDAARTLALALQDIGQRCGLAVTAFLTDMDQPLGLAIGNANEMAEARDVMRGGGPADLVELTQLIGGEMCVLGGVAGSPEEGRALVEATLGDGRAMDRMRAMVAAQGGDVAACDDPQRLPAPAVTAEVTAARDGWVAGFRTEALGRAVIALGGGRLRTSDAVDPSVGLLLRKKRGDRVRAGEALCQVGAASEGALAEALATVTECIQLGDRPPPHRPLVLEAIR